MFAIREIRIFARVAVAQLLCGNQSVANGPHIVAPLDARPGSLIRQDWRYRQPLQSFLFVSHCFLSTPKG